MQLHVDWRGLSSSTSGRRDGVRAKNSAQAPLLPPHRPERPRLGWGARPCGTVWGVVKARRFSNEFVLLAKLGGWNHSEVILPEVRELLGKAGFDKDQLY